MKKSTLRKSILMASALATSIASQLHGAAYTSVATGVWSDPFTWDPAGASGTPDVATGIDTATIAAGTAVDWDFAIDFKITMGGLVVVDGGTLGNIGGAGGPTYIGDGVGGAGTGVGQLDIQNGGLFTSGTAVDVVVGGNSGGSGDGVGTVNIIDGNFRMDLGALRVGVQGSTGTINVGIGGAGTAVLDVATNNNQIVVGSSAGAVGTIVLNSDGTLLQGTGSITVGDSAGAGTLQIDGGSLIGTTGEILIGSTGGAGTLSMSAGTISTAGDFNVGRGAGASGTALILGGTVTVGLTNIGSLGGDGTAVVDAGAVATVGGNLAVGIDVGSTGTLTISNGGTVDVTGSTGVGVGTDTGSGDVVLDGGILTHTSAAAGAQIGIGVGNGGVAGTGTLTIRNGGLFSSGDGGGSGGADDVAVGASLDGSPGTGTVTIEDGLFFMATGFSAIPTLYVGITTAPARSMWVSAEPERRRSTSNE